MVRQRQSRAAFRKRVLLLHWALGLSVGLYLVAVSVTGAILVYRPALEAMVSPSWLQVDHEGPVVAGFDRMADAARAAVPSERVQRIKPLGDGRSVEVTLKTRGGEYTRVFVHPGTAEVLGVGDPSALLSWALELHIHLLMGDRGRRLNGWAALASLGVLLSGLILWWPRNLPMLRARLRVHTALGLRRLTLDLHSAIGASTLPLLLLVVVTGVAFVFWETATLLVYGLTDSPPDHPATQLVVAEGDLLPVDALAARALDEAPGHAVSRIWPASSVDQSFSIELIPTDRVGEHRNDLCTYVELHPVTGQLLLLDRPADRSSGSRVMFLTGTLHYGNWGGHLSKALYVLVGLTPAALLVTGVSMWWTRRAARQATLANHATRAARRAPNTNPQEPVLEAI